MKITFCMYQIITGGIEKVLLQIIETLPKDYEIDIITKKPVTEKFFLRFFKQKCIKVQTLKYLPIKFDRKKTFFVLKWIYNLINKIRKIKNANFFNQKDLIVDFFNCSFANIIKYSKTPKIGWYHSGFEIYKENLTQNNEIFQTIYDKFVVLTKYFENELIKSNFNKSKIVQIYNIFDIKNIQNLSKMDENIPKNEKFFTFVGRFDIQKDHICVIKAFEKIVPNFKDVKIYFIGDGPLRSDYEKLVKSKNLQNNIIFLGTLSNPFIYVKNAIANILASPSEGLPNTLIEAMILKTLNISSNFPCASEVLLDGGIIFNDYDQLAQILEDILNNKIYKNSLINNAYKNVDRFKKEIVKDQILELFEKTANKKRNKV